MNKTITLSLFTYIFFIIISTGLAFFSFEGYSILSNTTSHLGAQGSPHSWLMNIIFIALGATTIWVTCQSKIRYHQIIGAAFGLSLIMTAFFHHAPLIDAVQTDPFQDGVHSFFANATGFSFTLLAMGHGFISCGMQRYVAFGMAAVAIIISIGMMAFPDIMGLLQRIMFLSAFGWLFFYMKPPENKQVGSRPD
ncbi:DUF998 domain-containing protein [Planococcus dechangensis]|uniref:DUF998 domain-containing protein n=1 Tax=Planococcus dechangensis TaxID=1176255 RepID=A0ABV9MI08_9BACL